VQGVSIFIADGFAEVEFLDPATRGQLIGKLLAAAKAEGLPVRTDSGGTRKRYIVPEYIAEAAGLFETDDEAEPFEPVEPDSPSDTDDSDLPPLVDEPDDESSPEPELEPVKDETLPERPPKPGTKGATKAAWTAYAEALGVEVVHSMTLAEIVDAVEALGR
jgi:hypothetical protein